MTQIPLALDFGSILMTVMGAVIAFVWKTLNEQIVSGDRRVETIVASEMKVVAERMTHFEQLGAMMPNKLNDLVEHLKRIELQLAQHHVTKAELKEVLQSQDARMARVEDCLRKVDQRGERINAVAEGLEDLLHRRRAPAARKR